MDRTTSRAQAGGEPNRPGLVNGAPERLRGHPAQPLLFAGLLLAIATVSVTTVALGLAVGSSPD